MNRNTLELFHALMKKGWIDRQEDKAVWLYIDDVEVQEELEDFKVVLGLDFFRAGDRFYMIPTQDNDLFLKNNVDYRRDIKAENTIRIRDLYLMNYLSIYLIYTFFSGEGSDPLCRNFISKEDFIAKFTEHCKIVEKSGFEGDSKENDYSENFIQLATVWLSKLDGDVTSQKSDTKYGIVNKILHKYRVDELFDLVDDDVIRPTRKLKDLMPYFLRKDRIAEIQNWIKEGEKGASDKQGKDS
ncbi:MAG: DUF6063 family protein [Ruminococcus sp.]|nr:DUF6063 family protein [Ruminococcus sp.]